MIKAIPPDSYDFGEPALRPIKRARYRMGPNDRRELSKLASEAFVDKVARLEPRPGEQLAYNVALGSTERYGCNRNADGFKAAECRRNHPTFVKFARAYREHANTDPARSYGVVKLSNFDEDMHRIELAIAYNGTKEAANRNGGLVADEELESLEKDGTFPTSMATKLPYDVCSSCGNKARSRAEYCHGAMCKHGGLRHNLGRTFADGHTLHADNPNNCWFDISKVARGADRTSHTLGAIGKAASAVKLGGAGLAEALGILAPAGLPQFGGPAEHLLKIAAELACRPALPEAWAGAFAPEVQPALLDLPDLQSMGEKLGRSLRALADERVVLPVRDFLAVVLGDAKEAAATAPLVAPHVPAAYDDLLARGEEAFAGSIFEPDAGPPPAAARRWAGKLAADYSLARGAAQRRAHLASIRAAAGAGRNSVIQKAASAPSSAARALARQYALYKVAALAAMRSSPDFDWLLGLAAVQDHAG